MKTKNYIRLFFSIRRTVFKKKQKFQKRKNARSGTRTHACEHTTALTLLLGPLGHPCFYLIIFRCLYLYTYTFIFLLLFVFHNIIFYISYSYNQIYFLYGDRSIICYYYPIISFHFYLLLFFLQIPRRSQSGIDILIL